MADTIMTLTEAHLDKLNDDDRRTIALRIVDDAVNGLNISIKEYELTNHPDLEPTPVHEAADWLRTVLTKPDNGYNPDTQWRHSEAVGDFRNAAIDIGKVTTGKVREFPPYLNVDAVDSIFDSVDERYGGAPHRPSAWGLYLALDLCGGVFVPGHETTVGYVLKALCDSNDPRLPALAESYMQSGLHVNLRPAINRATRQLARLDELEDLTRR